MLKNDVKKTKDNILFGIKKAIRECDEKAVKSSVKEGIQAGIDPVILADEGCIAAMREIGDMFEADEILIVQVLAASAAMKAGMDILSPEIEKMHGELKHHDKAVIGAQKEGESSIKRSILEIMLMVNDFDVVELTDNESIVDFIEKDSTFSDILSDCKEQLDEVIHAHPEAAILQVCEVSEGI
ncbi:putative cobalamin binding protein [Methanomethylovorans hollandica DSM 15978]|uniref:Putative cobalamin binding protein n=1 Tax=Methanomethylovorans hollandica (strain DSM 15978 / NBRC 107637 / DMS1) TaxID=867904 RepID=L0KWS7_METHD|nr:B12-binding domain-containing protein [Methanomethylovorans hollandica]AGB48419.1 putative cobalamin binding protein [Methanomethylovorans hollandica DSM 15978]